MTTYGWINMNGMQAEIASTHTESVYELNSIVDNLDANLSKARVANSQPEQVRLLSEIAIESDAVISFKPFKFLEDAFLMFSAKGPSLISLGTSTGLFSTLPKTSLKVWVTTI